METNVENGSGTPNPQNVVVNNYVESSQKNGMGTAGFVLALLGLILCWVPVLDWILWILGLVLSIIGVCRKPRGLAIAGLAISCLFLILVVVVIGAIFGVAGAAAFMS